jgi:Ca2+-binding RTX toxin-like protein
MSHRLGPWLRRVALAASVFLLVTAVSGTLASNVVAESRAGGFVMTTGANDVKPTPECSGITVQIVDVGSGTFSTSNSADLALGSAGVDNISARNGDDCVVGGSGNDTINGGNQTDVCIGGLGTDTFSNCETAIQ